MSEQLWLCLIAHHQYQSLCSISTSLKLEKVFHLGYSEENNIIFAKVAWQFCANHWQISSASFFPRWDATTCRDEEGEEQCSAWSHSASTELNHKIHDTAAKAQEILVLFQGQPHLRSKTYPSLFFYRAPKTQSTGSTQRWHRGNLTTSSNHELEFDLQWWLTQ